MGRATELSRVPLPRTNVGNCAGAAACHCRADALSLHNHRAALVAELADALGSGPSPGKPGGCSSHPEGISLPLGKQKTPRLFDAQTRIAGRGVRHSHDELSLLLLAFLEALEVSLQSAHVTPPLLVQRFVFGTEDAAEQTRQKLGT